MVHTSNMTADAVCALEQASFLNLKAPGENLIIQNGID